MPFNSAVSTKSFSVIPLDEIFDLIGIRLITSSTEDCYASLNIIHNIWPHKRTKFKDYIKYPKDNDYQSIHTTVYGPYNKVLEIQIRSLSMHYEAEDGVAAHWRYAGTERDKQFDRRIQWFKQVIEWQRFSGNAKEFIENLKIDFYGNEIVVLTPKGDPITIKEGSTPLDFAYELHTSIGNRYAGALVNGKAVPLDYLLKSGEIVQITTRNIAKPSRAWLKVAKTNRARSKIKHALGLSRHHIKKDDRGSRGTSQVVLKDPSIKDPVRIAQCCKPQNNDPIAGFKIDGKAIMVHKLDCPHVSIFDKKKSVAVSWKISHKAQFHNYRLKVHDRVGLLAEILNVFSEYGLTLETVNSRVAKSHVYINIKSEHLDSDRLKEFSARLKSVPSIIDIFVG